MYGMQRQQQPTTPKDQPIHDNRRANDVTGNEGADTAYHGLQMLDETMRAIQECLVENTKKLDTLLCMFSSQSSSQQRNKRRSTVERAKAHLTEVPKVVTFAPKS